MSNMKNLIMMGIGGVICLFALFIGPTGNLVKVTMKAIGILVIGSFLLFMIIEDLVREEEKKAHLIATLIISGLLVFMAGKDLVMVGMDIVEGTHSVSLSECEVVKRIGKGGIWSSFYITGYDELSEWREFPVNREFYNEYKTESEFAIDIICWEHSGIIKEIIE